MKWNSFKLQICLNFEYKFHWKICFRLQLKKRQVCFLLSHAHSWFAQFLLWFLFFAQCTLLALLKITQTMWQISLHTLKPNYVKKCLQMTLLMLYTRVGTTNSCDFFSHFMEMWYFFLFYILWIVLDNSQCMISLIPNTNRITQITWFNNSKFFYTTNK